MQQLAKRSDKTTIQLLSAEHGLAREGCRHPHQPPRVLTRQTGPGDRGRLPAWRVQVLGDSKKPHTPA